MSVHREPGMLKTGGGQMGEKWLRSSAGELLFKGKFAAEGTVICAADEKPSAKGPEKSG